MSNPLETLRAESGVIAAAPWSFAICLFVIGGVIFLILRAMKAQEIADLNSRLTLRNDEIADYRRKLDGKTPDEAKSFVEALEVEAAVKSDRESQVESAPEPPPAPRRPPMAVAQAKREAPAAAGERVFVLQDEYDAALAKTEGLTSIQAAEELQDLVGKWRTLRGEIFDIRPSSSRFIVFIKGEDGILGCRFDSAWGPKLSEFRPGEEIALRGRILGFSAGVRLDNCELVDTHV